MLITESKGVFEFSFGEGDLSEPLMDIDCTVKACPSWNRAHADAHLSLHGGAPKIEQPVLVSVASQASRHAQQGTTLSIDVKQLEALLLDAGLEQYPAVVISSVRQ